MNEHKNDVNTVKSKMTYAMDAIAFCYTGFHDLCKKHSFACKGDNQNWISKSTYLSNDFSVNRSTGNVHVPTKWKYNQQSSTKRKRAES